MSGTNDPPDPGLSSTVFNKLKSATFDSQSGSWTDSNNAVIYLLLTRNGACGAAGWIAEKPADFPTNPYGPATSSVNTVIANGTRNANGTVTYSGKAYAFALQRTANNTLIVEAVET